jgi:hypothetical protein
LINRENYCGRHVVGRNDSKKVSEVDVRMRSVDRTWRAFDSFRSCCVQVEPRSRSLTPRAKDPRIIAAEGTGVGYVPADDVVHKCMRERNGPPASFANMCYGQAAA